MQVIGSVERRVLRFPLASGRIQDNFGFRTGQGGAEMRHAPIGIPTVIVVEQRLHIPAHRIVFLRVRAGLDLGPGQIDCELERVS